jgi:hypothetical protein
LKRSDEQATNSSNKTKATITTNSQNYNLKTTKQQQQRSLDNSNLKYKIKSLFKNGSKK